MKKILLLAAFCYSFSFFGQHNHLKTQLEYCKHEEARVSKELEKFKGLVELQSKEIQELKGTIQSKEDEIAGLHHEIKRLEYAAVNMLNIALKLEEEGDYKAAMMIYKALVRSYPTSLEAAASRIKIEDLTTDLENYKK
ncbi:hypothetical protein OAH12_02510 [Cyclobacteriaceae bacterium]|nr:hypothetical protein [Cyclobacteriaceae bacterium]